MLQLIRRPLLHQARPILLQITRTASTAATPNSALAHWLDKLPDTKLHASDYVALSHVQSLVSTLEMPEHGSALDWKRG